MITEIQKRLLSMQDKEYRDFTAKLNPTVDPETIIGVRLPDLRALVKELKNTDQAKAFLSALPHEYLEENHMHSFFMAYIKDFDERISEIERFLPYIDNWAVCDSMRVKAFDKTPEKLLPYIESWLKSEHTYTVRYGILCLMNHYLTDRFDEKYPAMVASVHSGEYYIIMMQAWYFATALAKQYDAVLPYLTEHRLDRPVHNKTIQKAIESYRITDEQKAYLRTLKIK